MGRRVFAAMLLLALAPACKKTESAPDAGLGPSTVKDEDLAFSVEMPAQWKLVESGVPDASAPDTGPAQSWRIAEAMRLPPKGHTYLVPPRVVITADPTRAIDADAVIRSTMNDLRGLEQKGARLNRSTLSTRLIDGVTVGDIEIAYDVGGKKETPREVVQRSLVTLRNKKDGSAAAWAMNITYMSEDAELVTPEVQQMIAGLRFVLPPSKAESGKK